MQGERGQFPPQRFVDRRRSQFPFSAQPSLMHYPFLRTAGITASLFLPFLLHKSQSVQVKKRSVKAFPCLEVKQSPAAALLQALLFHVTHAHKSAIPGGSGLTVAVAACKKGVKGAKLCSPFIHQGQLSQLFPLLSHGQRGWRGWGGGSA